MRIILLFITTIILFSNTAFSEIRVVSYNMKASDGLNSYAGTIFQTIGNETFNGITRPIDILALNEMDDGGFTTESAIVTALNNIYGSGTYAYSTLLATGDSYMKVGIVYNTTTVQLIEQVAFKDTNAPRKTGRYRFRIIGYNSDADVYVYVDHYKAYDDSTARYRRAMEALRVRWDKSYGGDALLAGTNIIYCGDYNLISPYDDASMGSYDTSTSGGYDNAWYYLVALTSFPGSVGSAYISTGNGQAVDPAGFTSLTSWNTSTYKILHSYSSTTPQSRLDFQLVSKPIYDGKGVSLIKPGIGNCRATENSYHVFCNDGTHTYGGRLVDSTGTKYTRALRYDATLCSDHLPVVADYQTPAIMSVEANMPQEQIVIGNQAEAYIKVRNSANVTASVGADQLDYKIQVLSGGTLTDANSGVAYALDSANSHEVLLDTSAAGQGSLHIIVTSSSQACVNASYEQTFSYNVNELDLFGLASTWLKTEGEADYVAEYDLYYDGIINFRDFAFFCIE